MRFDRLRARGVGPFTEEIDLDLAGIDGRIIAIVGGNGEGKTTLLELWPGSIYRQCPTRGSLIDLATMRGAFVETTVCADELYLIRQNMDPISRKGETLILNAVGVPIIESAKVSEFKKWVADHLPSAEELYSSSFAVQGRRGILDMAAGERKGLLVKLLGLEKLERLAEVARNQARDAKAQLDQTTGKLAMVPTVNVGTLAASRVQHGNDLEYAMSLVATAERSLKLAEEAAADSARLAEFAARIDVLERKREQKAHALTTIAEDIARESKILEEADDVLEAAKTAAELRPVWADADSKVKAIGAEVQELKLARDRAKGLFEAARQRLDDSRKRIRTIQTRLSEPIPPDVTAERDKAEADWDVARSKVVGLAAELDVITGNLVNGKDNRITGLRTGLRNIAECGEPAYDPTFAQRVLSEDDDMAASLDRLPRQQAKVREELAATTMQVDSLRLNADILARQVIARQHIVDERARVEMELEEVHAEVTARETEADDLGIVYEEAAEVLGPKIEELEVASKECLTLLQRLNRAEERARKIGQIESARATKTAKESEAKAITADIDQIDAELAALPEIPEDFTEPDLSKHRADLQAAKDKENHIRSLIVLADKAIEEATATNLVREQLEGEKEAVQRRLAGWNHLATAFGRDGIQALEMSAALPEINTIANDLLHTCHSSRFTVEVSTDRLSTDGKKTLETLEIRVIDTTNGRDAAVETYSGGECVIVGEALSLALTTVACRHNGIKRPTLIRDESGAALDATNGRAYVAMLRRAADMIDADKVLIVSHSPEIQDLADAKVLVSDGKVSYL